MNAASFTMDHAPFVARRAAGQTVYDSFALEEATAIVRSASMAAARILYAIARFALFLALFVIAASFGIHRLGVPYQRAKSSSVAVDSRVDFPIDWATYPVVAKAQTQNTQSIDYNSDLFTGTATEQAQLGDVFARYDETSCTAGGSSCTASSRTFFNVRVGDLDANGTPAIATDVDCLSTPNVGYARMGEIHECAPASLTLRRSPDGNISVVTFVDPEPTEKPIAAFTRSAVPRSQAPLSRGKKWLYFFALALLAGGAFSMFRLRPFFGARGILAWKEARLADNVITCGEFSVPFSGVERQARTVLIASAAMTDGQTYRDGPSLDRSAIFFGTQSAALARAQLGALATAILCFASAGIGALCAAFVLF